MVPGDEERAEQEENEPPVDAGDLEEDELEEGRTRGRLRRLAGRLMDRRELAEDTRELFGSVVDMSDKAKTEVVKLVAREARNYLEELRIKEELLDLATSHSLELKLSIQLEPKKTPSADTDAE